MRVATSRACPRRIGIHTMSSPLDVAFLPRYTTRSLFRPSLRLNASKPWRDQYAAIVSTPVPTRFSNRVSYLFVSLASLPRAKQRHSRALPIPRTSRSCCNSFSRHYICTSTPSCWSFAPQKPLNRSVHFLLVI